MAGSATGVGTGVGWQAALDRAIANAGPAGTVDLAFVFVSSAFGADFAGIVAAAGRRLGAAHLIGCSGQGLIATRREIENEPAIVVLPLALPGATFTTLRFPGHGTELPEQRPEHGDVSAWLLFADPFSADADGLLQRFNNAYPGTPLIGGIASAREQPPQTAVFLDGEVFRDGAVALGIGGDVKLQAIVSQGCMPIGRPWTITGVNDNLIQTIGGRPAVQVLIETLQELDEETRVRAQRGLQVGLAMDEYRDEHGMGDFLIRNLMGYQKETGAIAIGDYPRLGQTVQFQFRDARAAGEHLRQQLVAAHETLGESKPAAALLCSCNGRGSHLFGPVDHDPRALAEVLGDIPVAGLFCNGEIGPVGGRNFLHGFTATVALFST
ncbi:MAG: FIST signal transduction protein [Dehalococcoidia bacterium]